MIRYIPMEVVLSAGYALFLAATAAILEKLAAQSHRRSARYEVAGFRYHSGFDRWECPEGRHLVRVESDPLRSVILYRAPAHHCNACSRKSDCTDSDSGREIERRLDLWLQTGLSHFHRGLSLSLLVLASAFLIIVGFRYPRTPILAFLGGLQAIVALSGARLLGSRPDRRVTPEM